MGAKVHRNSLKPGYTLHWYEIKEVLGQGGFGITYLAYDNNLHTSVAIKEYLPIEMAVRESDDSVHPVTENHGEQFRWGLDRFLAEARTLAQFNHPNIVRVLAVFEGNNTGYMIMNYEEGMSLAEQLRGRNTLEEPDLLKLLIPLMGGLEQMHDAGFIHRDIKPDNIFIRNDGSPVLLDFGSARQALGGATRTLTSLVTPGYAPFEQYYAKSDEQGPWTDVYGLGATLYRAITGMAPMDAVDRSNALLKRKNDTYISCTDFGRGKYTERFLLAIDHALKFNTEDRPQTIAGWRAEFGLPEAPLPGATTDHIPTQPGTMFHGAGKPAAAGPGTHSPPTGTPVGAKRGAGKVLTALLILGAVGAGVYFYQPDLQQGVASWQNGQEVDRLLGLARDRLQEDHYTVPADASALTAFQKVLVKQPDNAEALLGLQTITDYLVGQARSAMQSQQFENAEKVLLEANNIRPDAADIQLAKVELEKARKAHAQQQADEKARDEQRKKIVVDALSAAESGAVTRTLSLIEQARTLNAGEPDIAQIKNHLYLSLESQMELVANTASQAAQAGDTKAARQALDEARQLKTKLESLNLPAPQLSGEEKIRHLLQGARLAASNGFLDMTVAKLAEAKSLGADAKEMDSIKQLLRDDLEARADQATAAVKLAMERNDTQGARKALAEARAIKVELDKLK